MSVEGPNSLRVSWEAIAGAEIYTVTASHTKGDNHPGPCNQSSSHTVSVNTTRLSVVLGTGSGDQLRTYTVYSVTVTAVSELLDSTSKQSESLNVTTGQRGVYTLHSMSCSIPVYTSPEKVPYMGVTLLLNSCQ